MTNPLFKRDGATGKVHYYYNSHLGQPLKLFDKAGKITWAARSQAFGQATVFVNETENNLRFPGQYEDGETGLYYNFVRYYEPSSGRYLQQDPASLAGGLNTYGYGFQNPLYWIDPLGLFCLDGWFKGALAGAAGGLVGGLVSGGVPGALAGAGFGALGGAIGGALGSATKAVGEGAAAAIGHKGDGAGGRYVAGRGGIIGGAVAAIMGDSVQPAVSEGVAGVVAGKLGNPAGKFGAGILGGVGGALGAVVTGAMANSLDYYFPTCGDDNDERNKEKC